MSCLGGILQPSCVSFPWLLLTLDVDNIHRNLISTSASPAPPAPPIVFHEIPSILYLLPHTMFVKTTLAAAVLTATKLVLAQSSSGFVPLASQSFTYTALPYQADPNNGARGTQTGYNICNSTVSSALSSATFPISPGSYADSIVSDRKSAISLPDVNHQ